MVESEKFFLQWREFEGNVRSSYKTLLSTGDYSDVTLASRDGHRVACHRLILASSSPFLANLVSSHPTASLPLTLPISKLQLTFLLDFIYNGEVEVEKEQLYQFLNTGERMQLKGLVKPEVQEPAADTKKFDLGESVNAEQDSSEAPEKSDFDSMIRRDGDKWSCRNCGKIGDNKHNLSRHVLRHLEEGKTFPCNFCGKESRSSNGLSQHIVKRHPTGSVLSNFDQKPQESSAAVDEKDAKDVFDQEMEELEKEEDSLEIDLDDAEEEEDSVENQFNDVEDGSTDQSRRETTEDFKEKIEAMIEKKGDVWRCIECNKVAEDSKARFRMKNHVQTHMQGLTVSCNFCEHVGSTSAALRNHKYKKHREMMEIGKEEGKYKCGFCGKGSRSKKGRANHKYKYHKEEKRSKVLDGSVTDEEEVTMEEVADEELEEKEKIIEAHRNIEDIEEDIEAERRALEDEIRALKLAAEERARHTDLKPDFKPGEEISPESGFLKTEPLQLKTESWSEEENNGDEMGAEWEESLVSEVSGSSELVDFKAKIEALIEKNGQVWRCVVCGKSAEESKARDRLKNHVQIHMELTHACDVCGKTCNTKSGLGQHMYKQHKDVVEEMVNKKNESKQFKCSICNMKSTTNAALEQHIIKRHKEESIGERKVKVEKSFECNVCGKFSTTKKALGAHKYKRH